MNTPDAKTGLVTMGGELIGGHAVCCLGYDDTKEWLIFQNSWGTDFGMHGRFKLSYAIAERLMSEGAEVCAPTEY
jgi:C1A family cysteine protease